MKTSKKVIILVMSSSNPVYQSLENSIKRTWYNIKDEQVEIIFYKERFNTSTNDPILLNSDLYLPCEDGFYNIGLKTILAFDWVRNNYEFDYIYRSNLGAFVYPDKLLQFIENKPKEKFYCGIPGKDTYYLGREVNFASGSGYFLSKDLVNLVVENKELWNHSIVDDVALGDLLSNFSIEVDKSAVRMNICDDETFYQTGDSFLTDIDESKIYHIRLRSADRNIDIQNMNNIYKKITN